MFNAFTIKNKRTPAEKRTERIRLFMQQWIKDEEQTKVPLPKNECLIKHSFFVYFLYTFDGFRKNCIYCTGFYMFIILKTIFSYG